MKLLSYFVFGLSICFLVLGVLYLKNNVKTKRNYLLFFTIIGSFLWGFGYSLLIVQFNVSYAVICRAIGLIGSILFAACGVNLVADIASFSDKTKRIIMICSLFGIILCPFLVMPSRLVYIVTDYGMNYEVVPDLWNNLYNIYTIGLFILFIVMLVCMRRKANYKRDKVMNNGLWLFFGVYLSGIIIDLIISSFGFGACPGSTISQFLAIFIIYKYLIYQKNNSLSLDNVFNHIHHSIEMPIMVFNSNKKLDFATDAFYKFFNIDKKNSKDIKISDLFILESEDDIYRILGDNLVKECFTKETKQYCSLTVEKIIDSYEDLIGYIILVNDLTSKFASFNNVEKVG